MKATLRAAYDKAQAAYEAAYEAAYFDTSLDWDTVVRPLFDAAEEAYKAWLSAPVPGGFRVTAVGLNPATRQIDLPVEYIARDRIEAIRWANCNQDYIRNVKIEEIA
jgi:hypothetical protein